jgi:CheY-like chemotaxis protein
MDQRLSRQRLAMTIDTHVVIIEDSHDDSFLATRILNSTGVANITSFARIPEALIFLEEIADGNRECPQLILLDLNVGLDSGFEVLRFYKSNPALHTCRVIVWTGSGSIEKELCEHFGVECVGKGDGEAALATAIWKHIRAIHPHTA